MGYFNVACSVSSLSMGGGTRIGFIPLLPSHHRKPVKSSLFGKRKEMPHLVKPTSTLIYPNCYFNPFSLPIFGKYNEYGGLENIERDETVEAIEKFFGITIEKFIECITGRRDIEDTLSTVFEEFAVHKELYDSYDVKFNEDFLLKVGFQKEEDGFHFGELPIVVNLFEPKNEKKYRDYVGYRIYDSKGNLLREFEGQRAKNEIQRDIRKHTEYLINVSPENQEKVKLLDIMSGMYVHGEIYNHLASHPDKSILKEFDNLDEVVAKLEEELASARDDEEREYLMYLHRESPFSPISTSKCELLRHFEWAYFADLYADYLLDGKLRDKFAKYKTFYWSMYSCNRFYFPAMNGEQDGNHEETSKLFEKALEISNRNQKCCEDDEEEFEEEFEENEED